MTPWLRLAALLRQTETRHWVALGGSALLHLAVFFGLRQEPAPLPETVSFEVALQPPEEIQPKRPKTRAVAAKKPAKPSKPVLAKKPKRKAEPRTLEARFKRETEPRKDMPKVELPSSAAVLEEATAPQAQAKPARAPAAQAGEPLASASAAGAAQPGPAGAAAQPSESALAGAAGMVAGGSAASGGEAGLTLAASRALSLAPGGGNATQGAEASPLQGGSALGAHSGQGAASFSASASVGGGLNLAAGAGASAQSASASAPVSGGEPQGLRLTASGALSSLPEFAQGKGALAAGQLAQDAGAATPADAQGRGQSLSSTVAGGASVSPLAGPAAGAGKGGQAEAIERAAGTRAGGAAGPAPGRLAGAPTPARPLGGAVTKPAGNSSQAGKSLALAPGEPGSGPQWAVLMLPVQTGVPILFGQQPGGAGRQGGQATQAQAAPGGADETSGAGRAGSVRLAQSGAGVMSAARPQGVAGVGAGAGSRTTAPPQGPIAPAGARGDGHAQTLSAIQPAQQKIIKADSKVDTLDVLAPSNYCPLPIHAQPDNRAPQAREEHLELPSYAANNPGFVYPLMANVYGVEGKLIVRVEVLADGRPGRMLLKQSSGNGILDRDAQEQLARWRFNPARKNGQAVVAWIDVPVIYRLPEGRK